MGPTRGIAPIIEVISKRPDLTNTLSVHFDSIATALLYSAKKSASLGISCFHSLNLCAFFYELNQFSECFSFLIYSSSNAMIFGIR